MMTATKHNIIVISGAAIISASILFIHAGKKEKAIRYQLFQTSRGWGYNILVRDSLFIHQETVPAMPVFKGFDKKEQASATAKLVLQKLRENKLPVLQQQEVEDILQQ